VLTLYAPFSYIFAFIAALWKMSQNIANKYKDTFWFQATLRSFAVVALQIGTLKLRSPSSVSIRAFKDHINNGEITLPGARIMNPDDYPYAFRWRGNDVEKILQAADILESKDANGADMIMAVEYGSNIPMTRFPALKLNVFEPQFADAPDMIFGIYTGNMFPYLAAPQTSKEASTGGGIFGWLKRHGFGSSGKKQIECNDSIDGKIVTTIRDTPVTISYIDVRDRFKRKERVFEDDYACLVQLSMATYGLA
jgi:hypothetical protein